MLTKSEMPKALSAAGWQRAGEADRWEVALGPLWEKGPLKKRLFALQLEPRHCGRDGSARPGVFQTLFDAGLGAAAWDLIDRAPCVTLRMEVSFIRPAPLDQILVCDPTLVEEDGPFVYLSGLIRDYASDEIYATSNSIWKRLRA